MRKEFWSMALAGSAAGVINGLFGAGGGMVLIPLLTALPDLQEREVFPTSIAVMLPVCLVSLWLSAMGTALPWSEAVPYLLGSALGGVVAGWIGKKIPTLWLHRGLGILILYGGWRYLC